MTERVREKDEDESERESITVDLPRKRVDKSESLHDRLTGNVINQIGPARYFNKNSQGEIIEDWDDVFDRVSGNIADAEYAYGADEKLRDEWKNRFERAMRELRFMPNTPTISSAGTELQMLSACVAGDSPVYTASGLKRMDEIDVGDKVLTHTGEFKPVTAHWSNGEKETIDMVRGTSRSSHTDVTVTPDHKCMNESGEWVRADELSAPSQPVADPAVECPDTIDLTQYTALMGKEKPVKTNNGHVVVENDSGTETGKYDKQYSRVTSHVVNDEEMAWIAGVYLAEGDVDGTDTRFTIGTHEESLKEELIQSLENVFDVHVAVSESSAGGWTTISVSSPFIADMFRTVFGTGVDKKSIPKWTFAGSDAYQQSLLDGLLRGDGHESDTGWKLTLANPDLVYEASLLARNLGYEANFKLDAQNELSARPTSSTYISTSENSRLGTVSKEAGNETEVYDMEVAGDHSFVVGDFVVHNCFVLSPDDSMEDILETAKKWGLVEKTGGGMGGAFYRLRPKGSIVKTTGGKSSGPMPFIELFDAVGDSIRQGSIRSGAQMAIMHAHHADVGRFAVSKRTEGRLSCFNISVAVTDEFIEAVENDDEYTFYTSDTLGPGEEQEPQEVIRQIKHFWDPKYEDAWNEERDTAGSDEDGEVVDENLWRDYDIEGIEEYRDRIDLEIGDDMTLPAGLVWSVMMDGAWENGEPGVFHLDEVDREHTFDTDENPEEFQFASNPCAEQNLAEGEACLTGDELVTTGNGIREIDNLEDGSIVASDNDISQVATEATLIPQGERDVVDVELEGGMTITCTPDHEFMTDNGAVEAKDLVESGASVRWMENNPVTNPVDMDKDGAKRAFTIGWMHGDGWMTENTIGISFNKEDGDFEIKDWVLNEYHEMFGERKPLKDDGVSYQEQVDTKYAYETAEDLGFNYGMAAERSLPDCFYQFSENEQLAFLRGLFTADSGIGGKGDNHIKYATSSYKLADELQSVLGSLGIQTRKYVNERDDRNDQIQVRITKESAKLYMQYIGYETSEKQDAFSWDGMSYTDSNTLDVVSVSDAGKEEVYDLNVPETNVFFANGALVHNCNLGHVNLSLMVKENAPNFDEFKQRHPDQDLETVVTAYLNRALDHDQLESTINTGVRFLDNVVEQSEFPIDEITDQVESKRKIGLGLMGFAQMLVQMGIPYGSEESQIAAKDIMRRIDMKGTEYSHELAKIRGPFDDWEKSKWANPDEYDEWFRKHGHKEPQEVDSNGYLMRNHSVTTIAPTGTSSRIADTTGGCEPIYNTVFFKNVSEDVQGDEMLVIFDDYLREVLEENGIDAEEVKEKATELMYDNEFDGISDVDVVPDEVADLFVTTEDLSLDEHLAMQTAFQEYCDSGISKTGNARTDATREDISDALITGLKNGIKGTTVYRQGSRQEQVNTTKLDNRTFTDEEKDELLDTVSILVEKDESFEERLSDALNGGDE